MSGPWDDYASKPGAAEDGPWSKYQAAAPAPAQAVGFTQGLTTNLPTQGFAAYAGRNVPRMVGGVAGAAAGAGIGSMGTAALGGAAGEAARQALVSGSGNQTTDLGAATKDVLGNVGVAGAEQGVGQGANLAIGKAVQAVGPSIMESFPRIPGKYADRATQTMDALWNSKPMETVKNAYDTFERYTGLQNLEQHLVAQDRVTAGAGELEKMVIGTANKVMQGAQPTDQELYLASQAASRLKMMAKFQDPQAQMAASSAALNQGKDIVDDALQTIYPEYSSLRTDMFDAKMNEAFSSMFPLNKNMTPNKLGLTVAAGLGGAALGEEAHSGRPGRGLAAAALPFMAISPMAYKGALMSAPLLAPAARTLAGSGADMLAQYFRQQQSTPRNPAPPMAPR